MIESQAKPQTKRSMLAEASNAPYAHRTIKGEKYFGVDI
jgi:hypothetical protein